MSYENSKSKKFIKDYLIKERIGVGSYGLVFKVTKRNEKGLLVLKQIPYISKDNKKQIEEIQNEAKLLSLIDSKFIVKYYDSFEENNNIDIIMEYCEGGDLSSFLSNAQKMGKFLSEDRIWKFFIQMSLGLECLHNKKILHRDLKSMNIFLTKTLDVKIGDLGVAKLLQNTSHAYTFIGTPFYLSPEVCEEKPYNDKSDVWALGCITYEMLTFKHPYEASNHAALFLKIINGKYEPIGNKYSEDMRRMIDSLLEKNHIKRPSMSQIIKMPIFISKAKQFGLLECVVDALESHNRDNRKNRESRKTPVKLTNKMGISGSNLVNHILTPHSNGINTNHSSSNIYAINHSKERSTTDAIGKPKQYQSQQKVKVNMIDYNYLKYKEQAQMKKIAMNSDLNSKRSQISKGKESNSHQMQNPNQLNLNLDFHNKKGNQWGRTDSESSKMIISSTKASNNDNQPNEEDLSYKNKYLLSKRSNVSETRHSSINTSVNSSRKDSYHGIVSSNIKVKRDSFGKKADFSANQEGNDIKFNPGQDLNKFIKELNMKSVLLNKKSNTSQCDSPNINANPTPPNGKKKNINHNAKPLNENASMPLWNESDANDANCDFEVIEAKEPQKGVSNNCNDNSYDDGEYNYHHNPNASDDDNGNDNEEETVSMLKSSNFNETKQEANAEKESNELIQRRSECKKQKEFYFNEIAQHSSVIDIGKLFELYKSIEKDFDQIDEITLKINEYITKSFPLDVKASAEFSKLFYDYIYYELKLNNIEKLLNERKAMI